MRVLHIFYELKYSGAEIMYADAATLFQQEGVELHALSTSHVIGDFENRFKSESIKIHHIPLTLREINPCHIWHFCKKLLKLIKTHKIEVLHIHRSRHFVFFSLVGYIAKIKVIRTVHNVFKHRKLTWLKGYLERYTATRFLNVKFQAIGESVYNNELYYYKNKSTVINNWYDENKFYATKTSSEKKELRASFGISTAATVIISTGGCSLIKNHHDIIKALQLVNQKIECFYLHLGQGITESEEQLLAKELEVSDKILFLGNREDVRNYLILSDIYLMPSRFEGLGNAALEAMACGLPSILYDVPGLKDLIRDNDNGFLISESHAILADKILYLYENPELRNAMGNNAKHFAEQNFSMQKGVKGILELYRS